MKILVIDDEEEKCRLYRDEFEDEGHKVMTAMNGAEAMELFMNEAPDLVTLDIWMSQKDEGIQLLRQMKEIRPGVPIVMLTAYDFRDDFALWCADAYVVKSSDLAELKSTLKNLQKAPCENPAKWGA